MDPTVTHSAPKSKRPQRVSDEEWNEWVVTHRPLRSLPPPYRSSPKNTSDRVPQLHWAIPFTARQSFEACRQAGLTGRWDTAESNRFGSVELFVKHIRATFPWLTTINYTASLLSDSESYILSLFTNKTRFRYQPILPLKKLLKTMKNIQEILQTKEKFLWYWDFKEGPRSGWPPTTDPEFEAHLSEAFDDPDDYDDFPCPDSDSESDGSETEMEDNVKTRKK
ncbi:hypothetical protein C8Q75DRAFT_785496 [Abortiporus biennis]|nr:hypothetical protein C8Q75DRAFT_785496 [Abortiporus biennis]